eukprot:9500922-Pyramimonas_sp.AAC.1
MASALARRETNSVSTTPSPSSASSLGSGLRAAPVPAPPCARTSRIGSCALGELLDLLRQVGQLLLDLG